MDTKKCNKCNEIFPTTREYFSKNGRNGLRTICKKCDKQYHRDKYVKVDLKINKCVICDKEFESKLYSNFCSNECRWKHQKINPIYLIKCKNCDRETKTNHKEQKYCSVKCQLSYENKEIIKEPIACKKCGSIFLRNQSKEKYCSNKCRKSIKGDLKCY